MAFVEIRKYFPIEGAVNGETAITGWEEKKEIIDTKKHSCISYEPNEWGYFSVLHVRSYETFYVNEEDYKRIVEG